MQTYAMKSSNALRKELIRNKVGVMKKTKMKYTRMLLKETFKLTQLRYRLMLWTKFAKKQSFHLVS